MGNPKNVIALNGKIYDVVTGAFTGKLPDFSKIHKPTSKIKSAQKQGHSKTIDGVVIPDKAHNHKPHSKAQSHSRHSSRHLTHRQPQHAKTLMRSTVKKPVLAKPTVKKVSGPIASTQATSSGISGRSVQRARRATLVKKSKDVVRFATAQSQVVKRMVPLSVKSPGHSRSGKHRSSTSSAATAEVIAKPFIRAKSSSFAKHPKISEVRPIEAKKPKVASKSLTKKITPLKKSTKIILSLIIVILLAATLVWYFLPELKIRFASIQAGFSASLPTYQPAGFNRQAINYKNGEVTLEYKSSSNNRGFAIKQTASSWNSETLLANIVKPKQKPYQSYQEQGKTIYIYDGANATWVSGGVLYQVAGNSNLNNNQLLNIANSL